MSIAPLVLVAVAISGDDDGDRGTAELVQMAVGEQEHCDLTAARKD